MGCWLARADMYDVHKMTVYVGGGAVVFEKNITTTRCVEPALIKEICLWL